jgi:uncharacterized protein
MEASADVIPENSRAGTVATAAGWLFRGGAAYAPATPWSPWAAVVATVAVFFGAVLATLLVMLAAYLMRMQGPDQGVLITIVGTMIQQVAMIALTFYAAARYGGRTRDVLALQKPANGLSTYLIVFVMLVAGAVIMNNIGRLIDPNMGKLDVKPFQDMLYSRWWWMVYPLVAIGAPLSEELLVRGFLFSAIAKSRLGVMGAGLLTSAAWAAIHFYSPAGMIQVFFIGLFFSWVLARTGSLRVTIIGHGLYNFLMATLLLFNLDP